MSVYTHNTSMQAIKLIKTIFRKPQPAKFDSPPSSLSWEQCWHFWWVSGIWVSELWTERNEVEFETGVWRFLLNEQQTEIALLLFNKWKIFSPNPAGACLGSQVRLSWGAHTKLTESSGDPEWGELALPTFWQAHQQFASKHLSLPTVSTTSLRSSAFFVRYSRIKLENKTCIPLLALELISEVTLIDVLVVEQKRPHEPWHDVSWIYFVQGVFGGGMGKGSGNEAAWLMGGNFSWLS